MSRILCHLVPASALLLASGCFLDHGRDAPGARRDSGVRMPMPEPDAGTDPPPVTDAGRRPDPPPPDPLPPPTMCPAVRADATCLESFLVEPGRAFELPVAFDTCVCCGESECHVAVDHVSQRIWLTTALCPDPCDCDACITPTAACEVPALETGTWAVEVNGAEAFELPVLEDSGFAPPPPACATYAEPDVCSPSSPLGGMPVVADGVCVVEGHASGETRIELERDCGGCDLVPGPCEVSVEPRYTDDLPEGGEIRVNVTEYRTACTVACTEECMRTRRTCLVPPLTRGHFYRVWVADTVMTSFTSGASTRACSR